MAYTIRVYPEAQAVIDALPPHSLRSVAEVFALLELTPWVGLSVNQAANPDAPLRNLPVDVGGLITYLVLERDQEVHVASLVWVE